ncbi:helix-turn-helix domain-containing protein [Pelagicoccus sp. SDUM812002]|uniref:helix-turn-helix domain-containing protein n=1 Tax=Pelagicoccus sp. SDUM812002 TaxID=3041266 RepID=UPI00280FF4D9|nr:helix-turn-helix domain-containing protein [Pelagicoccus sp. SDUM812002]MDQ8187674.1 helix-turn-helix domain-containing protein [Pelagicoccus sp. SDUM812002]
MTDSELQLILQEGEGYTIEFKENANTDLSREMVAFANASGGRIFIGINDQGKITGVKSTNPLKSKIQEMATACDPAITIEIETFQNLLVVHVPPGQNKPYRCTKGFYLRNGANAQKLTTREITEFVQAEGKTRFDEILRDDIDAAATASPQLIGNYLETAGLENALPNLDTLGNLGAVQTRGNRRLLNNAGLLFFAEKRPADLFHATITCALYKGTEKLDILDRKDFSAPLLQNIEDALLFLKQHLKTRYEITTLRRKNILEIPEVALREAVVNAVCHRDYYEKGANVMIELFDDRLDITNPGGLPKGLLPEKFGKLSIARNPTIASLLLRCGYIEKMGTGIHRIQKSLSDAKLPKAKFDYSSVFTLTFTRVLSDADRKKAVKSEVKNSPTSSPNASEKTSEKTSEKIVHLMAQNQQITIAEMSEKIGVTTRSIERNIKKLQAVGRIKRVGGDHGGHWEVLD